MYSQHAELADGYLPVLTGVDFVFCIKQLEFVGKNSAYFGPTTLKMFVIFQIKHNLYRVAFFKNGFGPLKWLGVSINMGP